MNGQIRKGVPANARQFTEHESSSNAPKLALVSLSKINKLSPERFISYQLRCTLPFNVFAKKSTGSEIILSKLAEIVKKNYFIFSNYSFDFIFKNRRVSHHYDKLFNYYSGFYDDVKSENNSNNNTTKTDGYDDIVHQLVGFLFLETLNRMLYGVS